MTDDLETPATGPEQEIAERSARAQDSQQPAAPGDLASVEGSPEYLAARAAGAVADAPDTIVARERHDMARHGRLPHIEPSEMQMLQAGWPVLVSHVSEGAALAYESHDGERRAIVMTPLVDERDVLPPSLEVAQWLLGSRIAACDGLRNATNMHEDRVVHLVVGPTTFAGLARGGRVIGVRGDAVTDEERTRAVGENNALLDDGNAEARGGVCVLVACTCVERGCRFVDGLQVTEISP